MTLPFLPGRYDPLAGALFATATGIALGSLLLVPVGVVWTFSRTGYRPARWALGMATVVAVLAALATAASASIAGALVLLFVWVICLLRLWKCVSHAQAAGAAIARTVPVALIVAPLALAMVRLALVGPVAEWSRDRAIANAAAMIADIEQYRARTGAYPTALNSLGSDYPTGIIGIRRYQYEPAGDAYNLYFMPQSTDLATEAVVMYNPRGEQDFSSHDQDLLRLSPDDIRRQRGYFTSDALAQANWRRFLFD
jgi:hypothetical protein